MYAMTALVFCHMRRTANAKRNQLIRLDACVTGSRIVRCSAQLIRNFFLNFSRGILPSVCATPQTVVGRKERAAKLPTPHPTKDLVLTWLQPPLFGSLLSRTVSFDSYKAERVTPKMMGRPARPCAPSAKSESEGRRPGIRHSISSCDGGDMTFL
jgi:hypothetical protein